MVEEFEMVRRALRGLFTGLGGNEGFLIGFKRAARVRMGLGGTGGPGVDFLNDLLSTAWANSV